MKIKKTGDPTQDHVEKDRVGKNQVDKEHVDSSAATEAYRNAGVDIAAGDDLVDWLKKNEGKTPHADRVVAGIGGFAALFRAGFPQMKKPCLVSSTDGVGTKVKLASHFGDFSKVGQDLVGMCVNDILCVGAEPLFFLDYYACGKLELDHAKQFLKGLKEACNEAGCALIGGETAEMPGVYAPGDFDCAGFAVGIVDEEKILGANKVRLGDALVGFSSSGFHSNGYSLLRKVFSSDLDSWREELLKPTALYSKLVAKLKVSSELHALAHITGGGLDNLTRVLSPGQKACVKRWDFPKPFREVQKRLSLSDDEIVRTLNCGIGLIAVVQSDFVDRAIEIASEASIKAYHLGHIESEKRHESAQGNAATAKERIEPSIGEEPRWEWL